MVFDFAGKAAEVERLLRSLVKELADFESAHAKNLHKRALATINRIHPIFTELNLVLFGHYRAAASQPHRLNLDGLQWPPEMFAERELIRKLVELPPFALNGEVLEYRDDGVSRYVAANLAKLEDLLFEIDAARSGPQAAVALGPQATESADQELVTMEFGARLVHRKVGTLKNKKPLPAPARPSVGNIPAEYSYGVMREFLRARFPKESIPENLSDAKSSMSQTV